MMETEEKYKVVIVDDERTAIDALRRELEPYREFEVKGIAGNGAKGKKMIMELHPDLLFLDVELPDSRSFSEGYRHGLIPFSFYSELFCYK